MRTHATGMTAPVQPPFEETALLWALAGVPAWEEDAVPGYPGTGHDSDHATASEDSPDHRTAEPSASAVDLRRTDEVGRPL